MINLWESFARSANDSLICLLMNVYVELLIKKHSICYYRDAFTGLFDVLKY